MALSGQLKALGQGTLGTGAGNVYNQSSALIYTVLKHIHLVNKTTVACWFSLYIGATGGSAAGTEIFWQQSISPSSYFDYWPTRKLLSTDFLSGLAQTATSIVYDLEGEQVVV